MIGLVRSVGSGKAGRLRHIFGVFVLIFGMSPLDAGTAQSADGSVLVDLPEDWKFSSPEEDSVVLLMADGETSATVTVFRESLGDAARTSALRYLYLKVDNFEKSFVVADQTDPEALLIDGKEAARTALKSRIPRPDGTKLAGAFIFTCLSDGKFLYTIVASTTAADLETWEPVLNGIAGSLRLQ